MSLVRARLQSPGDARRGRGGVVLDERRASCGYCRWGVTVYGRSRAEAAALAAREYDLHWADAHASTRKRLRIRLRRLRVRTHMLVASIAGALGFIVAALGPASWSSSTRIAAAVASLGAAYSTTVFWLAAHKTAPRRLKEAFD